MTMRTDCKHYESRTYASGDTVRKCRLDLAPEAPWRCPADCPRYQRRTADAGWQYGSLGGAMVPASDEPMGADVAALLDQAEEIVNEAGRAIFSEQEDRKRRKQKKFRKRRK